MSDFVATLNPMQRAAVELPAQHALILAGAGSGKTRVLTTRIAWLLAHNYARPAQILAVTFTNKAAREMRTRLQSMLSVDMSAMWVGTFHGISHRLLRLHAPEAGLPATFQIIDSADQLSLIKRIMKEAGIDPDVNDPRQIQSGINAFKERGLRASDIRAGDTSEQGMGVYRTYETRCQRDGLVDFAELLLRSVELLENNTLLREHYIERFRFVLVDEFQDTNELQFRWIKALSGPAGGRNSIFCVGDDDQSIYAFRGARVGNMADFIEQYRVQHIIKLEQNYRSTSHILEGANALIAHNANRMGKNLWTDSGAGEKIALYSAGSDRDEARSIVQDILTQHRCGQPYVSFAVLYRNNAQSRIIEQYLTANAVPYRIYGGLRFFDRQEIKDVMAYLRVMASADDTSVLRVINHPPRGIGATSIERFAAAAQQRGLSLWQVLTDWTGEAALQRRAQSFVSLIEALREQCTTLGLAGTVEAIVEGSGLKTFYEAQPDKDIRLENLSELTSAAVGYCRENGIEEDQGAFETVPGGEMSVVSGFLAQATLESDDKNESEQGDAVQMMTVHASKGLEFPTVYLTGLEQGLFPHAPRGNEDERMALAEERRLMYVAMTRAQKRLRMSWSETRMLYGSARSNEPSSFLEEIPPEHLIRTSAPRTDPSAQERSGFGRDSFRRGGYSDRSGTGYSGHSYAGQSRGGASGTSSSATGWRSGQVGRASEYLADKAAPSGLPSLRRGPSQSNRWNLAEGDRVRHSKFGTGTVQALLNAQSEDSASVRVKFSSGVKELLLKFAKLEKI